MINILVVDDEQEMDFIFKTMFEDGIEAGLISIDFFSNPVACYEHLKSGKVKYDYVLTDISMPQMTGVELVKRLRESGYTGRIFFFSAFPRSAYVQDMQALKVEAFIPKPIDFDELKKRLAV